MTDQAAETPTVSSKPDEGTIISILIELAGFASVKADQSGNDPRIVAVRDVAIRAVEDANLLPDLLKLMFAGGGTAAPQTAQEQREDERRGFEAQFRQDLFQRCNQNRDLQAQAVKLLLQKLAQEIQPEEPKKKQDPNNVTT